MHHSNRTTCTIEGCAHHSLELQLRAQGGILSYMSYPEKSDRNKEIVDKRNKGWSWKKIANHYGLRSHGTVRKIYWREVVPKSANKTLARAQG
jgi:hypothetical protein